MFGVQVFHPGADARLVVEQDFVMQLRRLHRAGDMRLVANLMLSNFTDFLTQDVKREMTYEKLAAFARAQGGQSFRMGNADVFLILSATTDPATLPGTLHHVLLAENVDAENLGAALQTYRLPEDYVPLRERADHYISIARAAAPGGSIQAEQNLRSETVRGPLTPYSLHQIGKIVADLDVGRYVRRQAVYERGAAGAWRRLFTECYVSLNDLRLEKFPRVNVERPERLFRELCVQLDTRLLHAITQRPDAWTGQELSFNISVDTVLGAPFAQLCHVLPQAARKGLGFEIDRADLLLNVSATRSAVQMLKREGFFVCLDGLTPETLPYLNVTEFETDYVKLWVERDQLTDLQNPAVQKAIARLNPAALVFCHCDNDKGLKLGEALGVTKYQGWLIDDVVEAASGV